MGEPRDSTAPLDLASDSLESPIDEADELLELDRGVLGAVGSNAPAEPLHRAASSVDESLNKEWLSEELIELDRGIYEAGNRTDVRTRPMPTADRLVFPSSEPHGESEQVIAASAGTTPQPAVGGWLAVGVVLGGMVLGGSAALAVFHAEVTQIVAQWATRPGGF